MTTPSKNLISILRQRVLLADGAMGTQLQQRGLKHGECGELWNKFYPDKVRAIHSDYRRAGAELVLTNTFGANLIRLGLHQCAELAYELNFLGVKLAREAAGEDAFVVGDIGPLGEFLEPYGELTAAQAVEAFEPQVLGFVEAGADAVMIETMSALEEAKCAIEAIRNVSPCAILLSFTFESSAAGLRTMTGVTPEEVVHLAETSQVAAVGTNCGRNLRMEDYLTIVERMRAATDLPILVQPNAGTPEICDGKIEYREMPEKMATWVERFVQAGARIVGGCCGTTPDHISEFRRVLDHLVQNEQ